MRSTTKTALIVSACLVVLCSIAFAAWLVLGATVVAATGTLPGGWGSVSVQVVAVLGGGLAIAAFLFWTAARKPKP